MNDEMRPELKVWFPVFRVTTDSSKRLFPSSEQKVGQKFINPDMTNYS